MGSFPRRFWVTLGYGIDEQLETNAYDHALQTAGLCDYNIASLSSVPPNCQIEPVISKGMTYVPYPKEDMLPDEKTMGYFDQYKINIWSTDWWIMILVVAILMLSSFLAGMIQKI